MLVTCFPIFGLVTNPKKRFLNTKMASFPRLDIPRESITKINPLNIT